MPLIVVDVEMFTLQRAEELAWICSLPKYLQNSVEFGCYNYYL